MNRNLPRRLDAQLDLVAVDPEEGNRCGGYLARLEVRSCIQAMSGLLGDAGLLGGVPL